MSARSASAEAGLHACLEAELPLRLGVGRGTALFVHGWCYHRDLELRGLSVALDGSERAAIAHSMPRADVYEEAPWQLDPEGRSYRSGFWAIVPVTADELGGPAEVRLRAALAGGATAERTIGRVAIETLPADAVDEAPPAPPAAAGRPRIAICMATHDPPPRLFRAQVESLRAQTYPDWLCVVSDDASREERWAEIVDAVGDDPRFDLRRNPNRVGPYRNFERALRAIPADAELIAFCDQDDRWHPDKLEALERALDPAATLAYSDMNVVDEDGTLISGTYWTERATNHTDLAALVMVNTVTGAASLFRRTLLDRALPFPQAGPDSFHDHWIACVALALGEIRYVDRPLHDYVQHGGATLGHRAANVPLGVAGLAERARAARRGGLMLSLGDRLARWRGDYPYLARVLVTARTLSLRCEAEAGGRGRRALRRLLRLERARALALAWLAWRSLRGRRRSPTLGKERQLLRAALWPRALRFRARLRRAPRPDDRQSAVFAPSLERSEELVQVRRLARLIRPLELEVAPDAPRRVNVLIPKIDLGHFFGGYIAKLNLARRLAEEGNRVRVVCVDDPGDLPPDWRWRIGEYAGLETLLDRVELEFAHDRRVPLAVNPGDRFVATTWWTAHLAHGAAERLGGAGFVYLIQECEHLTFAMGSFAAAALETYAYPHRAVFSTEFLRDYFRAHRLGVYAGPDGDRESVSFDNAITPVWPPPAEQAEEGRRRLLFYARPEEHAHRNMFELGMLGLASASEDGVLDGWQARGVGAQRPQRATWGDDLALEILPRQSQSDYASLLREHAVGMALMCTPHPSLVPLEMASAGMVVVTNTFENKTAERLRAISENLIAVEPTIEGLRRGIAEAAEASLDTERRLRAEVRWPTSWEESFDAAVMARVGEFLAD